LSGGILTAWPYVRWPFVQWPFVWDSVITW